MSFYLILIEKLAHDDKQAKNQTSTHHPAQSNIIKMAFVRHTAPFFGRLKAAFRLILGAKMAGGTSTSMSAR